MNIDVKEFLAGLACGTMSPSLKRTFLPKLTNCILTGKKLTIVSLDLEAYAPGDIRFKPDKILLVAGMQKLVFEKNKCKPSRIVQFMLDGNTTKDIAKMTYNYCKDADAIFGHFCDWDVSALRDYGLRLGRGKRLPEAAVDIMAPFKNLGISAGQEHLALHLDWGIEKGRVSLELWQDAAIGELEGMSHNAVMKLRRRIRDERNKTCLAANLAQVEFISNNIRQMGKLSVKEVYPNSDKMKAYLGETK